MTLTTEQIEQVIDDCRKGAAMRGLFNKWIVEEMASELLRCRDRIAELSAVASLEAQPAAATPIYQIWDDDGWCDTSEQIWRETYDDFRKEQYRIVYTAPPAPAVPEEMTGDGVLAMHDCGYIEGWNACRAAMLAQPVSSGYKLPEGWKLVPVEPTAEMINAALASGALSIRTVYRVMLAAAPEGGNG
ncbi:TPA: hypothetical protein ACQVG6_003495 [Serratia marcescens]